VESDGAGGHDHSPFDVRARLALLSGRVIAPWGRPTSASHYHSL
jgi:hypothetical protein